MERFKVLREYTRATVTAFSSDNMTYVTNENEITEKKRFVLVTN